MSASPVAAVAEFHAAFGLPASTVPTVNIPDDLASLRRKLLSEEVMELLVASTEGDLPGIAQELADVVYVAYGTALTYGIDLDAVIAEVHRSNMSKLDADGRPLLREDGKVLKSDRYHPPNVAGVVGGVHSDGEFLAMWYPVEQCTECRALHDDPNGCPACVAS